jgi:glycosyltransferase involved in cell wall biosynthesis
MNGSEPRFSIVIPVKNGEKYIAESIESVLAQTYPNFELIILDNCSTDVTTEIINSYQDTRVSVLPAEKPLPIEQNWARVLTLELSEYLTILGHDDVFYPDYLMEISKLIIQDPDSSLYQAHFDLIDDNGDIIRGCRPIAYRETADQFLFARHSRQRDSFGTGYIMRTADYKSIGGLSTELPYLIGADDIAWYNLSSMSYKVCSQKTLFAYRYHIRSASRSIQLLPLSKALKKYLEFLERTDYLEVDIHRRMADQFLRESFTGAYRRRLMDLLLDSDSSRWNDYWATKERLILESETSSFIRLQEPSLVILELIRFLPSVIRKPLIQLLGHLGDKIMRIIK